MTALDDARRGYALAEGLVETASWEEIAAHRDATRKPS
jgi:hypothetical protein